MELTQLKQFKVIAETQNITKASEMLFVSQSALSQMLAKLEEELGCKLFDRKNKRIYLNENGEKALRRITNALNELEELKAELTDITLNCQLQIASASPSVLWFFTKNILNIRPDIFIDSVIAEQNRIKDLLLNKQIDAAISFELLKNENVYSIPFTEIQHFVTVPYTHPLAKYDNIELKMLNGYHALRMKEHTFFSRGTDKILLKYNILYSAVNDVSLFYDTLSQSDKYITVSNSLEIKYKESIYSQRKIISIKDPMPRYTLYLQYLKENSVKIAPLKKMVNENYKEFMV